MPGNNPNPGRAGEDPRSAALSSSTRFPASQLPLTRPFTGTSLIGFKSSALINPLMYKCVYSCRALQFVAPARVIADMLLN